MEEEGRDVLDTLRSLRQGALLLGMGYPYLATPAILTKIGQEMTLALNGLRREVDPLRSQFPGRLESEVDLEPFLKDLRQRLKLLQDPRKEQLAGWERGDLGRELELAVSRLTAAVLEIKGRVEGSAAFTLKGGSSLGLKGSVGFLSGFSRVIRPLLLLLGLAALLFGLLFATMEKEGTVLDEVAAVEARIQSSRLLLKAIAHERDQVSKELGPVKFEALSRSEKVEFLEKNQKLLQIADRQWDIEAEIQMLEKKAQDRRAVLEKMRKKSFWVRLLRL
jgi:hypothetical protein